MTSPADSEAPKPFQFGLRSLFFATAIAAAAALLFRLLGRAALPSLIGGAAAVLIHLLSRGVRDAERRQVIVLTGHTFTAWLAATTLLRHFSATDRVIAAGSIPAALVVIVLLSRRLAPSPPRSEDGDSV